MDLTAYEINEKIQQQAIEQAKAFADFTWGGMKHARWGLFRKTLYTANSAVPGALGPVSVGSESISTPAETVSFGAAKQVRWGRNVFFLAVATAACETSCCTLPRADAAADHEGASIDLCGKDK